MADSPTRPPGASRIELPDLLQVPATEAKNRFGDLLYNITLDGAPRVIERNGRPVAVVVRYRDYVELVKRAGTVLPPDLARDDDEAGS